jgi:hypothetical protein
MRSGRSAASLLKRAMFLLYERDFNQIKLYGLGEAVPYVTSVAEKLVARCESVGWAPGAALSHRCSAHPARSGQGDISTRTEELSEIVFDDYEPLVDVRPAARLTRRLG